ncbi:hypothetical protein [Hymenobacter negativus]|uniref:Uncharacterized protein n=1 Tax=Hymenobacter negativus TaxID=2795026 RepID=A0ABS0Q5Z3_9BACT|nr:hypothetical protein [Hymenobacter negativus]MBH8558002.1 hypothetical protein [Hymenobacter negativus]
MAPVVLPVQELPFELLTTREIWWRNPPQRDKIQASANRFIGFRGVAAAVDYYSWHSEKPTLLYRKNQTDTVWVSIPLVLPDYASHFNFGTLNWDDDDIGDLEVDTCNLDHRGEAEVLVTIRQSHYGSGGGQSRTAVNLIDVSGKPRLLLVALVEAGDSWHGPGDSQESGSSDAHRRIGLKRELLVSRIVADQYGSPSLLTPLKPGRYRYQGGRLVWVGR